MEFEIGSAVRTRSTRTTTTQRMQPHSALCDVTRPVSIESPGGALSAVRADVQDGCVILPGGFACPAPATGITTVAMDRGWLVHIEAAGVTGGIVTIAVEAPADAETPADDATLARLALESRFGLEPAAEATLHHAWTYRRACERLVEPFPGDGGPVVPVRWLTLSYENRVHIAGIGTVEVGDDDNAVRRYRADDGRTVRVRRAAGPGAPAGAVEVVVSPKRARITTSLRAVPLDSPEGA